MGILLIDKYIFSQIVQGTPAVAWKHWHKGTPGESDYSSWFTGIPEEDSSRVGYYTDIRIRILLL